MVPQPGRSGRGDGLLQRRGARHVERLRPAQAIGGAPLKGVSKVSEVIPPLQLAMAVDDDDQIPPRAADANVPCRAREVLGIIQDFHVGMNGGQRPGDRAGLVVRSTVHN